MHLQMKKDYMKGMADSADLVVLGAFFGTGSKGGIMSVFLMGCYDEDAKIWKTVCKAGNGHDDKTLLKLNDDFRDNMRKIDRDFTAVPDWLICSREVSEVGGKNWIRIDQVTHTSPFLLLTLDCTRLCGH